MSKYAKMRGVWSSNIHKKGLGAWERTPLGPAPRNSVGKRFKVIQCGNIPELVGQVGTCIKAHNYRQAVTLRFANGQEETFVGETVEAQD